MGLDMYLSKKTYVKKWDHYKEADKYDVVVTKGGKPTNIKPERVTYVIEELGYWRKANQIHAWFIENCNNGDDNNGSCYVERAKLEELLKICKEISQFKLVKGQVENGARYIEGKRVPSMEDGELLSDEDKARCEELLPTTSGFFFGSTDYDQYYMEDVKNTVKILEDALADEEADEFEYRASW